MQLSSLSEQLIHKLFPPQCIFCGSIGLLGLDLCQQCFNELPRNLSHCYRCAEKLETSHDTRQICGRCQTTPPNFDCAYAPFLYQDKIRFLITQLKFAQQFSHARLLANLLLQHLTADIQLPDCLIPMPLHLNRYRERQFNQAIELTRHISRHCSIKMDLSSCIRVRDTSHQTGLTAKQRQDNMHSAFAVRKTLSAKHVVIIDDVLTTGATASALALALKQSGVARVDIWVCARA